MTNLRLGGKLLALLNQFFVGDRVMSVTSDKNSVASLAIHNRSTQLRSYLLINHSNRPRTIQTSFRGWRPKNQRLTQHFISSSGYQKIITSWNTIQNGMIIPSNAVILMVFEPR
jgi:hypothetical protein